MSNLKEKSIPQVKINWKLCKSYEEAKDHINGIYLHEIKGEPFYWGKVSKSIFGGNKRKLDGTTFNPRYGLGYRHWIEGSLRQGAKLYIGQLEERSRTKDLIGWIEETLIKEFPTEFNRRKAEKGLTIELTHSGNMPHCLKSLNKKEANWNKK
ncbi:hypothetical protein EHQ86_11005 [Leptospira yasudae]|nr:hypothetical protein EHQ86_11005 [Leptospira yasudae]